MNINNIPPVMITRMRKHLRSATGQFSGRWIIFYNALPQDAQVWSTGGTNLIMNPNANRYDESFERELNTFFFYFAQGRLKWPRLTLSQSDRWKANKTSVGIVFGAFAFGWFVNYDPALIKKFCALCRVCIRASVWLGNVELVDKSAENLYALVRNLL